MQQGKTLKIFLAIIAIFLVGVIGYMTLFLIPQNFYSPAQESQDIVTLVDDVDEVVKIDTSDWQIYVNDKFNLIVDYPSQGLIIGDCPLAPSELNGCLSLRITTNDFNFDEGIGVNTSLLVHKNSELIDATRFDGGRVDQVIIKNIKGLDWEYFYTSQVGPLEGSEIKRGISSIIKINGLTYKLSTAYFESTGKKEEVVDFFESVLSTIKFIESNDVSDWQTYRNDELKFETIYPSDFYVDSSQTPLFSRVTFLPNDEERRKKGHRFSLDFWGASPEDTLNCKEDQDDLGFVDVDGTFAAKCGFQDYGDVARNHWSVTVINEKYKINFICQSYREMGDVCDKILSNFKFIEPIDTLDWATSNREEYSISHPSSFRSPGHNENDFINYSEFNKNDISQIKIAISRLSAGKFKPDTFNQDIKNYYPNPELVPDLEEVSINDKSIKTHQVNFIGATQTVFYFFNDYNNFFYVVAVYEPGYENNKDLVDKILSTFKFIN